MTSTLEAAASRAVVDTYPASVRLPEESTAYRHPAAGPRVSLRGRHLVSMADFSVDELREVLDTAHRLKQQQRSGIPHPHLAGKTLAMIFQKPSQRTRVSFEVGMTQLGGHAIFLGPSEIGLGTRESPEDTAQVLSRYCDLILARVFGHDLVAGLARHSRVPVINGLSDFEHPCQVLADLLTIEERRGALAGCSFVYVGDGNNMAHSLMLGCALTGMHCTIVTPPGYAPESGVVTRAQEIGRTTNANIAVTHDVIEGVRRADVLYTDVWASMGQEAAAAERAKVFKPYQVNAKMVARASKDVYIMHCLPAHYGEEITYDVSRLPGAVIFDQAENRLHAQKAVMVLVGG